MFEKSTSDLAEEIDALIGHEAACNRLIGLVETDPELEVTPYFEKACLATLERLSDIIAHRVQAIDQQLEHGRNREFENFMKGKF